MTTLIILVTHGLTRWNLEGRIQGHTDVPLNDQGRDMAEALGERMCRFGVDAVYSSDLIRAVETAAPTARRLGLDGIQDRRLREGRSQFQERSAMYPTLAFPVEVETEAHVLVRMQEAMGDIARNHSGERVLVVSHGAAVEIFISHVLESLGRPAALYSGIRTALNHLEYRSGLWTCIGLNDREHLAEIREDC